jgi:hypothetical protein
MRKFVNGAYLDLSPDELLERQAEDTARLAQALSRARADAVARVDSAAEAVRLKYITGGAGQAATYLAKATQAREYALAGYIGVVPGYVQAEATARGVTPMIAAQAITAEETAWHVLGAVIETYRRAAKVAFAAAADETTIATSLAVCLAALGQL